MKWRGGWLRRDAAADYPEDEQKIGLQMSLHTDHYAPNSLQTMPSHRTITRAATQPSMACGPPSADMSSGIVMKGPMPIMFVMFSAVA